MPVSRRASRSTVTMRTVFCIIGITVTGVTMFGLLLAALVATLRSPNQAAAVIAFLTVAGSALVGLGRFVRKRW